MTTTPLAVADSFTVNQSISGLTTLTGNLGENDIKSTDGTKGGWAPAGFSGTFSENGWYDFDVNGRLVLVSVEQSGYVTAVFTHTSILIRTEQGGSVILNMGNGTFTYTAPAGYVGPDRFAYAIVDEQFDSSEAFVDLLVEHTPGANLRPIAVDDNYEVLADTRFSTTLAGSQAGESLGVLANDLDIADGLADVLSVKASTFLTAKGGVVSLSANGEFVYTPKTGFVGEDSFTYVVKDSNGAEDTATVKLNVGVVAPPPVDEPPPPPPPADEPPPPPPPPPANVGPAAVGDQFAGSHDRNITGNVLVNDSDTDGGILTASVKTGPTRGTLTLNEDGTFTYVPATGFVGADSFEYIVADGQGGTSVGIVNLTITNAGPEAVDEGFSLVYGQGLTGNLLANDTDADGDALTTSDGTYATSAGGTITVAENGDFNYVPKSGHYGFDTFSYAVTDTAGSSATGLVQIYTAPPSNLINGTAGNDTLTGTVNADIIRGLAGDDTIRGGDGDDDISGGDGKDQLYGDNGNDNIFGGNGKDTLNGGAGNDTLTGGANGDTYTGGAGADRFVLSPSSATDYDRITDFKVEDFLVVNGADFGLAAGALADSSYFTTASRPENVDHGRFVYNQKAKSLFWDDDGNASTANVLLTTFSDKVTITLDDFVVT